MHSLAPHISRTVHISLYTMCPQQDTVLTRSKFKHISLARSMIAHDSIVHSIRLFHDGMQACVQLGDGECSGKFDIGQGVRRGCVFAPLLFNIYYHGGTACGRESLSRGCSHR